MIPPSNGDSGANRTEATNPSDSFRTLIGGQSPVPESNIPSQKLNDIHAWLDDALNALRTKQYDNAGIYLKEAMKLCYVSLSPPPEHHRWNLEHTTDGIRICEGNHHRSADCEWTEYVPKAIL